VEDVTAPSANNSTPTEFCVLRTTTCEGYADHSQGCADANDDSSCGAEDISDGLCELKGGATYLCTYTCLSNDDCKAGATCTAGGFCSL
jgi:hypothetical protein